VATARIDNSGWWPPRLATFDPTDWPDLDVPAAKLAWCWARWKHGAPPGERLATYRAWVVATERLREARAAAAGLPALQA
jgi:hypothetical protein